MAKIINISSFIPLTDVKGKLNTHIESMNNLGWELFSIIQQAVGIQEYMILFWRKTIIETEKVQ